MGDAGNAVFRQTANLQGEVAAGRVARGILHRDPDGHITGTQGWCAAQGAEAAASACAGCKGQPGMTTCTRSPANQGGAATGIDNGSPGLAALNGIVPVNRVEGIGCKHDAAAITQGGVRGHNQIKQT